MKKLEAVEYGSRKPDEVTCLPDHVDVAENIRQETRKTPDGNSETVWVADVSRYTNAEYVKVAIDEAKAAKATADTASAAVAELSDLVLTSKEA